MTPSAAEVMGALARLRRWSDKVREDYGLPLVDPEQHQQERWALALLERYAPEMVERERLEAAGERRVRVVLTVEEARLLQDSLPKVGAEVFWLLVPGMRSCVEKLDSALRDLDEHVSLVEAKKENGE
jgi:hypothetical protein